MQRHRSRFIFSLAREATPRASISIWRPTPPLSESTRVLAIAEQIRCLLAMESVPSLSLIFSLYFLVPRGLVDLLLCNCVK